MKSKKFLIFTFIFCYLLKGYSLEISANCSGNPKSFPLMELQNHVQNLLVKKNCLGESDNRPPDILKGKLDWEYAMYKNQNQNREHVTKLLKQYEELVREYIHSLKDLNSVYHRKLYSVESVLDNLVTLNELQEIENNLLHKDLHVLNKSYRDVSDLLINTQNTWMDEFISQTIVAENLNQKLIALTNQLQANQHIISSNEEKLKANQIKHTEFLEKLKLLQKENDKLNLELNNLVSLSDKNHQHSNQVAEQNAILEKTVQDISLEKTELLQKIQDKSALELELTANLEHVTNELSIYKLAHEKDEELLNETKIELQFNKQQNITLLAEANEEIRQLNQELGNKELELQEQRRRYQSEIVEHQKQIQQEKQILLQYVADLKLQSALEKDRLRSEMMEFINK